MPYNYTSDDGFKLGTWITNRRSDNKSGRLSPERTAELNQLDMIWDWHAHRWQQPLAAARAYHAEHGTLRGAGTINGRNITFWLTPVRARRRKGDLSADQIADLDALGMDWNPYQRPPSTTPRAEPRHRKASKHPTATAGQPTGEAAQDTGTQPQRARHTHRKPPPERKPPATPPLTIMFQAAPEI